MARWEPNARERLQAAALSLFEERGYDRTTVGDIAARAELTERTFFRYFTDKREVLFSGTEEFERLIVTGVASAPKSTPPLEVVVGALAASSPFFETRRANARKRQALIAAHADLRERELIKFTTMAAALVTSLRQRGVAEAPAVLLARMGMTLFQAAYERWIEDGDKRDLAYHLEAALRELRQLTAEAPKPAEAKPQAKSSKKRAKR